MQTMDVLEKKIKEAEHFRDSYYQEFPESTPSEKNRAVREKVLPLLQDIPLDLNGHCSTSAEYNYICGRILNICEDFDANCERHLVRAVKLDPTLSDAWSELGECAWKRHDFKTSVDCFRTSLSHKRTAKCLSSLAIALRQNAMCIAETKGCKEELLDEAAKLCAEAVEIDPLDENAWHTLGNSYLTQFFHMHQTDIKIMDKAREAYEKALELGDKHYSSDLHLNYSTALKFCQDYGKCLKHLKIATIYDPGLMEAKERLEIMKSFLRQVNNYVQKKGKLSAKKMRHYQNSICDDDFGMYCKKPYKKRDGKGRILEQVSFEQLKKGINNGVVICGKVVAVVPNPETVPYTFIGCDREGKCCAFTVYNSSDKFGVVVGDSVTVPEPHIIDVKTSFEENGIENLDFRIVRIMTPLVMLRNGRMMSIECMAFCSIVTSLTA